MPDESQCHTSRYAPVSGVQALLANRVTLNVSESGTPVEMTPVVGSERMSERLSFSSTKYGPSVSAAVNTHDDDGAGVVVARRVGARRAGDVVGGTREQRLRHDDGRGRVGGHPK